MKLVDFIAVLRIDVQSRTMFDESTKSQRTTLAQCISNPLVGDWRYKKATRRYILSAIFGRPLESQTELDKGEHSALIDLFSKVGNNVVPKIARLIEGRAGREPCKLFEFSGGRATVSDMFRVDPPITSDGHARSLDYESGRDEKRSASEEQYKLPF